MKKAIHFSIYLLLITISAIWMYISLNESLLFLFLASNLALIGYLFHELVVRKLFDLINKIFIPNLSKENQNTRILKIRNLSFDISFTLFIYSIGYDLVSDLALLQPITEISINYKAMNLAVLFSIVGLLISFVYSAYLRVYTPEKLTKLKK